MTDTLARTQAAEPVREAPPTAAAYLLDADSEGVVRRSFADLGFVDRLIGRGSIETATEELARRGWPRYLIVDISGVSEPMSRIYHLAEICDPETEVIVVGDQNDIVLYRELRAAGVAEYFFKPLVGNVFNRTLAAIASGTRSAGGSRSGRLVFLLGVRGGVGVTTLATGMAWHFAESLSRRVLLLDLDLQTGDAALHLDAQPSHALREALEDPRRIDQLFLERGVVAVTDHLGLLASLEPLSDPVMPNEEAVMQMLQKLVSNYRYVFVDLPKTTGLSLSKLLHIPSTLLLVSDGGICSAREVARWREKLGPNTPERTLVHVLNKKNADGALPEKELLRVIPPPEVTIRWDREIPNAAAFGTKNVQKCAAMRDGLAGLSAHLSGAGAEPPRPLWKRMFG